MSSFRIDPTVTIAAKHKVLSLRIPLLMLLAVTGSICTFAVTVSMIQPDYKPAVFWFVTAATVISGCILSNLKGPLKYTCFIPPAAGILLGILRRDEVILGAKLFYNSYYSEAHNTDIQYFILENIMAADTSVTWFMCCVSIVISGLIAVFLVRKTYFVIYFLLTFVPVEFGLYEGLPMNMPAMLILVASWIGVLAIQLAGQRGQNPGGHRVRSGNIANCGIAAIAVTAAAVLTAVCVTNHFDLTTDKAIQEKRQALRSDIEDFRWDDFLESIEKLGITLGIFEDPDTRELGTKSRLEYKEKDEVKITFTELPENGIYLKNFTGSVYDDNRWSVLPDEVWENDEQLDTLFNKFECVPQILPFMSSQASDPENTAVMEIEPLVKSKAVLQPYAAYGDGFTYEYDMGCYAKNNKKYEFIFSLDQDFHNEALAPLGNYYLPSSGFNFSDSTTATFFAQLGVDTSLEMFCISAVHPPYIDNSEYTTQALQAALTESYVYRPFVYETYTEAADSDALAEVYASLPSNITETARNGNDLDTLGALRTYLAEQCEYSLSPGETPSSRDFVNYFLLENNKGYCMHYATAGTVIARYLGIPARYCEGYIISADMMKDGAVNSDGSVTVTLDDSASHAWCEFYVDGYGWIPYELTPGYYDTEAELSQEEPAATTTEPPAETETQTETQTEPAVTTTTTTVTDAEDPWFNMTTTSYMSGSTDGGRSAGISVAFIKAVVTILAVILAIAVIIGLIVFARRYAVDKRMRSFRDRDRIKGILSIYGFLMKLLQHMELTPENSQMLEFAAYVRQQLDETGYDGEHAQMLITAALAADMGGKAPDKEEIHFFIGYVKSLAEEYGSRLSAPKRLTMKYFYHLF